MKDRESTRLNSSHSQNSYAVFFFNDTATTEIYTLSLHDALPISGVALAVAASRVLANMLFGLKSTDTLTYALVFAVVLPAVLLAALLPALRASRVDPLVALRNE